MWSKITDATDNFLNRTTMYRLVLYVLAGITAVAVALAGFQLLPFGTLPLLFSVGCLIIFSKVSNDLFSYVFDAPTNIESVYITALILGLIISPAASMADLIVLFWAALLATASKYILALGHKHLFNPAAVAVVLTAAGLNASASWWIGNAYMALPVAVGSILIIRKIRHRELINSFLFTVIFLSLGLGLMNGTNILLILNNLILHSSLLFFAGIMLTEPLTAPSGKNLQFIFGSVVGFLFVPQVHIGPLYFTPEQALVIGNVFAYITSPDQKLMFPLTQKVRISPDTIDFIFPLSKKLPFVPGQYMEWTLSHRHTDSRGSRRFFTLASSPTENNLRISIKFPADCSSYKRALLSPDAPPIAASGLAGDFTLPDDPGEKLVFVAGGIGITPFRSMIKYLLDTGQKRDIVLLYSNRSDSEIVYRDVFDSAATMPGIRVVYHLTGVSGHFDKNNLPQLVPDYKERLFYVSGPHAMVSATERLLEDLGIARRSIKTDYFPGFV
jgi:ferredoxin-NADP reductase